MNPILAATRFYQMRASWLGDGGQPVSPALAQQRANTCLLCPLNTAQPLWETLTSPIATMLRRQIQLKAHMQLSVNGEHGLHVCSSCQCVLSLKVWTPIKHVKETTPLEGLDSRCWIRAEIANEGTQAEATT